MERENEPNYPITNKLLLICVIFSILPALTSFPFAVIVILMDVFSIIGILSVRNYGVEFIPSLIFLGIGVLLISSEIVNLWTLSDPIHWNSFLLALYLVLMGVIFIINSWERKRA